MSSSTSNDARLNVRIPSEAKSLIEMAAAQTGRTVNDFAVSTLIESARDVIEDHDRTKLTNRDRDRFMRLLDATDVEPNEALQAAARRYKRRRR